jgi:hypothetical protein
MDDKFKDMVTKVAMDEAIADAVKNAEATAVKTQREIRDAERLCQSSLKCRPCLVRRVLLAWQLILSAMRKRNSAKCSLTQSLWCAPNPFIKTYRRWPW